MSQDKGASLAREFEALRRTVLDLNAQINSLDQRQRAVQEIPGGRLTSEELRILNEILERVKRLEAGQAQAGKQYYTPEEAAESLKRKAYTIREWCRHHRIQFEKDEFTGRVRIPAAEIERLRNGGGLLKA